MPIDRQRSQTLFRRMSRLLQQVANKPQPKAVHHLRTTARRIEALVETLAPDPTRKQRKLLKRVDKLRRLAGRLRDMHVQTALLRGLDIGREADRRERLLNALSDLKARREEKLVEALDKETIRDLRKRLRKVAKDLGVVEERHAADAPSTALPFDPVGAALQMFSRISREQGALREESLHAYRLKTKSVRYVAEMAGADKAAQAIVADLTRMQRAIGDWHDWLDLAKRARKVLKPDQGSALLSALDNITGAKLREAMTVCTDVRNVMLERSRQVAPPRKSAASVPHGTIAATA